MHNGTELFILTVTIMNPNAVKYASQLSSNNDHVANGDIMGNMDVKNVCFHIKKIWHLSL